VERIRFRLDEHMAHAIARAVARRGVDITTASDTQTVGLPDDQLLTRCHVDGRVLVTQDRDYLRLHHRGAPHAGVVFCEQGTRSIGATVEFLLLLAEVYSPAEMAGRVEFVP
jgi:hypothetical protein